MGVHQPFRCHFKPSFRLLVFLLALVWTLPLKAALIQVLHTNDLHSHMHHATDPQKGGFVAVQAVMQRLRSQARASNIPVLTFDAGDFSEGGRLFFGNGGYHSFDALNAMGYNAVTVGNHDYLMGPQRFNELLGLTRFAFPMLAANLHCQGLSHFRDHVKPFASFTVGEGATRVRIAVLGLTTDDTNYTWRMKSNCQFEDPIKAAKTWIPIMRRNHDFVIALTHIGLYADLDLIRKTQGIDLVIGGHSHTALFFPEGARNTQGQLVPIVQAGMHGEYVGELLIDGYPGSPLQVLKYQLNAVSSRDGLNDSSLNHVREKVEQAQLGLEQTYGKQWLEYPIGFSEVVLKSPMSESTEWGDFMAEAMRQAGQAEIAFDVARFHGLDQSAGIIRRLNLLTAYPRQFEADRRMGWTVWAATVPGHFIIANMTDLIKKGINFSVAGLKVETEYDSRSRGYVFKQAYYRNQPLSFFKEYRMAMPEGLVRGGYESQRVLAQAVMLNPVDTRIPIWLAIERH